MNRGTNIVHSQTGAQSDSMALLRRLTGSLAGIQKAPLAPAPSWYLVGSAEYRRLLYRASYRGMRETELILRSFLPAKWTSLADGKIVSQEQLEAFVEEDDPDIMRWINAKAPTPKEYDSLITMIKEFTKN